MNYDASCCRLCPRECGVDRTGGHEYGDRGMYRIGVCGCDNELYVARAALHMWEEPCISGESGSGTVFFAGCPLGCVYCQNAAISGRAPGAISDNMPHETSNGISDMPHKTTGKISDSMLYKSPGVASERFAGKHAGKKITTDRLAEIFIELQERGANNINLVTPTHYTPHIVTAIKQAKLWGLRLPVVYNTGGYEKVETLKMLDGLIDIYLPDMKYMDPVLAARYSHAADYPEVARKALAEMYRQVGGPVFDAETGIMKRGMIVRHLVLPGHTADSKAVIRYLYETYKDGIYISIMSQYTPMPDMLPGGRFHDRYPELARKVTGREYDSVVDYAIELGVENAFIQEGDVAKESFIPEFNGEGV